MSNGSSTARRLVLIRLLLVRAEEQAKQQPPFSWDSINRLHDAAEMFLALAAEENDVGIPNGFMGYWSALEKPLGRPLSQKAQMQKLNKVRVNLKHYGLEPTTNQVSKAVAAVRSLISDECQHLLGLDLEDVSLVDVVTVDRVRNLLNDAEENWRNQNATEAFGDLAGAFETLVLDYRDRKQIWHGRSVFDSTEDMTFEGGFFRSVEDLEHRRFEEKVIKSLENLDFNLMVVGLGIDLRRYGRFKALTPKVIRFGGGNRRLSDRAGVRRSRAEYEFCRDFVVAISIHLSELDYDIDFEPGSQRHLRIRRSEEEE